MKTKILFIALIALATTACHKHNDDNVSVTFTIDEPTANDTIAQGAELHFEGTIVGSGEMHGYVLSFINKTTMQAIASYPVTDHSESYLFHQHYVNALTDTTTVICRLAVDNNNNGNTVNKEIEVVCLP